MRYGLSIEELETLSNGNTLRCDGRVLRASKAVQILCKKMLHNKSIMRYYTPILDVDLLCQVYVMDNRHWRKLNRRKKRK